MGSLAMVSPKNVISSFVIMLVGGVPLYLLRWRLNVLSLGEEEAKTLGLETGRLRLAVIICSSLLTADFGNQLKVLSHVRQLARQGLTIIMASHVPDHAFFYATKVMLLSQGGLFGLGKANDIITEERLRELYGVNFRIIQI